MNNQHAPFSFGIEEEYLLVDLETRDIAPEAPRALLAGCEQRLGRHFSREYISAQIEFGTPVCTTSSEARRHLHRATPDYSNRCRGLRARSDRRINAPVRAVAAAKPY